MRGCRVVCPVRRSVLWPWAAVPPRSSTAGALSPFNGQILWIALGMAKGPMELCRGGQAVLRGFKGAKGPRTAEKDAKSGVKREET